MPQITIYVSKELEKTIVSRAKKEKVSLSRWISARLEHSLEYEWPADYFGLFGSVADIERPPQPDGTRDRRESL
ncbi:MAG TPA: toxin-antitoxin system, antitoxin component [Spirochaetota bacterium]|nr:toxin-antitoxin system, antitoxin component [Spirochaetota bacterium]